MAIPSWRSVAFAKALLPFSLTTYFALNGLLPALAYPVTESDPELTLMAPQFEALFSFLGLADTQV